MLDFLFRCNNPTNHWRRATNLSLSVALDEPSLNGVPLGARIERLQSLGRSTTPDASLLYYQDLGVTLYCDEQNEFNGFHVDYKAPQKASQPYVGDITWKGQSLTADDLSQSKLPELLGEWYWLDTDEDESIAFYEFPSCEIQFELSLTGQLKTLVVINAPLMADPEQRASYGVDKPWPPSW